MEVDVSELRDHVQHCKCEYYFVIYAYIAGNNVTNIVIQCHVYVYICHRKEDEIRDSLPSTSTSECSRQQPTSIRPSCLMVPGYEDDYVVDSPSQSPRLGEKESMLVHNTLIFMHHVHSVLLDSPG